MNNNKKYKFIITLCIVISILARIFNPGWEAFFLIYVSPYQFLIFGFTGSKLSKLDDNDIKAKWLFISSCITLVIPYLLYPNYPNMALDTAFFGLIDITNFVDLMSYISICIFVLNVVLLIWGFIYSNKKYVE